MESIVNLSEAEEPYHLVEDFHNGKGIVIYPHDASIAILAYATHNDTKPSEIKEGIIITQIIGLEQGEFRVIREYTCKELRDIVNLNE